jgi:stringent starvation protein A
MIVLYSSATDPFSHRSRFVLFEKGMDFEIKDVDMYNKPDEISQMNQYGEVPILLERDLILYEANIINEYIDERFPHPQLMPVDPINRSKVRLGLLNFDRELYAYVKVLESRDVSDDKKKEHARSHIRDQLTMLAPMFLKNKYFMGEEFSMLDIAIAPLLWRLTHYKIELPKAAAPIAKYAERLFARQGFIECLTPSEKVMRR